MGFKLVIREMDSNLWILDNRPKHSLWGATFFCPSYCPLLQPPNHLKASKSLSAKRKPNNEIEVHCCIKWEEKKNDKSQESKKKRKRQKKKSHHKKCRKVNPLSIQFLLVCWLVNGGNEMNECCGTMSIRNRTEVVNGLEGMVTKRRNSIDLYTTLGLMFWAPHYSNNYQHHRDI